MEKTVFGKNDIINYIYDDAKNNNITIKKGDLGFIVNSFIDVIKDTVMDGNAVNISTFARFDSVEVEEKQMINNLSDKKETIIIPKHRKLVVKPSNVWKKEVSEAK